MYYCESCCATLKDNEIIPGYYNAADDFANDSCDNCGSEDIKEIKENDLCYFCGEYHKDDEDYESCANGLFYDIYIISYLNYHGELNTFLNDHRFEKLF